MKVRLLNSARLSFPLASAIAALLALPSAHAAILYYDGGTSSIAGNGNSAASAISGNWNTGLLNWDAGAAPYVGWDNLANDTAFFGAGAAFAAPTPGTITLTSAITTGGIIFNTSGYTITGSTLTFGGTNNTIALNNLVTAATISSAIGTSSANMTFTAQNPIGAATLTFGAAGGWTGSTMVNAGITLQLNSTSTALLNTTTSITLNGGVINQNATSNANRISDTTAITSYGGTIGTTNTSGANVYNEVIGSADLVRGLTTFVHNTNQAGAGTQTLTLSGLTRTGATNTSTVNFGSSGGLSAKNLMTVTGATATTAGQIIGAWATAGNTGGAFDYAIYGSGGSVLAAGATLVAGGEAGWTATTDAYNNNVVTQTLGGTRTITALRNSAASAATLTLATGADLRTYGVLNGAATTFTIAPGTGGVLTTPSGGGYLYLNAGNGTTGGTMTVSAPVTNNGGTVTVVKSGLGTLNLTGTNTFTGGIVVNSGSVVVTPGAANGFVTGAAGADIINGGNLTYSSANAWGVTGRDVTFNGTGTLTSSVAYTGGTLTVNSGANAVLANTGNLAYATTTGSGAIIHTPGSASSLLNLGNASGFTGNLQNRGFLGDVNTGIQFSNLGDGGALQFAGGNADGTKPATFTYNGSSTLTFSTRQIQILERVSGNNDFQNNILTNNSADAAHIWTISTDLLATGGRAGAFNATGTAFLVLSGTNTGNNAFNGVIGDGQYGQGANGNIGVTKSGTGASSKWILGGNNTYSGPTAVSVGILNIQHANALGSTASGTTVANAARLELQGGITTAAEALTLTPGSGGAAMLLNVSGNNIWSGSVTSNTATSSDVSRIQSDLNKLTVSGAVSLTGSAHQLVFQGVGDIEISGQVTGVGRITSSGTGTGIRTMSNNSNNYTGATAVNGGTLAFTSIENVGATSSSLGAPVLADATISVGGTTTAGTLRYSGTAIGGHTSDRVINLAGTTGGATIEANGTGPLVLTGTNTATGAGIKTLTLSGTNIGNNSIGAIVNNSVTNTTSVTKSGTGTWVLSGTNSYTGATAVTTGTLLINGNQSTATGAVSVAAVATLGGNGTVGGATTFTGASVHAPGSAAATVGTQTFSSTVTYGSGTIFNWDLDTLAGGNVTDPGVVNNAATGTYDRVTATGAITATGSGDAVFKIVLAGGDSFADAFWNSDKSWTNIFTGGSGSAANLDALFNGFEASGGLDAAGVVTGRGQFTLSTTANTLSWTAVPEPTSALVGLLIGAGLLRRRRSA